MNQKEPLVSVILPAWNAARTIQEAIDSILQQSLSDLELIVCNDASSDNTAQVVEKIRDPRIRLVSNQSNMGPGSSRDQALTLARGQWAAFTDADDVWAPSRLENLVSAASPFEDVLVFDDTWDCHDAPAGMVPWKRVHGPRAFGANGRDPAPVSFADFILQPRLLMHPVVPIAFLRKFNISHSSRRFFEDTEYFLSLAEHGLQFIYVPRAMYYYRYTPGSLTAIHAHPKCKLEVFMQADMRMQLAPDEKVALGKKINMTKRELHYTPLLKALKMKQWQPALILLIRQPFLIPEFLTRLFTSIPYHLHRLRHHARSR